MFEILLIVIVLVHLHLEYRIWVAKEDDVFAKYRNATMSPLTAAKWAYLSKAVWLVGLILLQYFGVGFREAVVFSFTAYALLIQILLPFKIYNLLNLGLALACFVDWWMRGKFW